MGRPKGRTNKIWKTEEKIRIVNRYLSNEGSQRAIASEEGIARGLMSTWLSKYYKGGYEALENKRKPGNPYGGYSRKKNLTYVEQLEYDNFTLTVENKALKKGLNPERVWLRAKRK